MLVGVGLVAAQQLTGQPALLFYVVDIFREVADSHLLAAMLSFAGAKLLAAILVMLNLDSWGRRTPLIAGLVLMFASSGSIFMFFYDSLQKDNAYTWGFVALIDLFGMGYEVSVGATTFVLLGEIFPGDVKAEALSVAFMINYLLVSGMIFLVYYEVSDIGYSVVWGQFAVAAFVFVFFTASLVPETKGKTLEQIQREFQQEFEVPDFEEVVAYLSGGEDGPSGGEDGDTPAAGASVGNEETSSTAGGSISVSTTAVNPFHTGGDLVPVEECMETTPLV